MRIVKEITYRVFEVTEETDVDIYTNYVRYDERGWSCSCRTRQPQHRDCEDILAVKQYLRDNKCQK